MEGLSTARLLLRSLEMVALFVVAPTLFALWRVHPEVISDGLRSLGMADTWAAFFTPRGTMIPTLLAFAGLSLAWLLVDSSFDNRRLGRLGAVGRELPRIIVFFSLATGAIGLAVAAYMPEVLFRLPRDNPGVWVAIMLLYPALSVWPQEVLYRAFFHHRYGMLLPNMAMRIVTSAAVFGYMHVVFLNWVAPALTFLGGLLFAYTYERTKSVAAASVEHALYGCCVFTIGIGSYFYGGFR